MDSRTIYGIVLTTLCLIFIWWTAYRAFDSMAKERGIRSAIDCVWFLTSMILGLCMVFAVGMCFDLW